MDAIETLKNDFTALKATTADIPSLQAKLDEQQTALRDQSQKLEEIQTSDTALKAQITALQQSINDTSTTMDRLKTDLDAKQQAINENMEQAFEGIRGEFNEFLNYKNKQWIKTMKNFR